MTDCDFLAAYVDSFGMQFQNDIAALKDLESSYLVSTRKFAQLLGFKNAAELIGLSDGDAPSPTAKYAEVYYQQDRTVEQTRSALICLDNHNYHYGFDSYIFTKTAVINPKTENVLGTRLIASKPLLLSPINIALEMQGLSASYNEMISLGKTKLNNVKLTNRQHLVLFLTINGYSQGEIVKFFKLIQDNISEAVVKDTLRVLKVKFGATSKAGLIMKVLKSGRHTHIPAQLACQGSFVLLNHEFKIQQ